MLGTLTVGSTALMVSIGHRTGLFDSLAGLPPSTSAQLAAAAGLHERYVREWLGAMTTARIVVHDPVDDSYRLPVEHAAVLTRAAGANNLASVMRFLPLLAQVEDEVVGCFERGGGVPFPASEVAGDDFSEDAVAVARAEAARWVLRSTTFDVRDVTSLDGTGTFELITAFDAIHDQAHPASVLQVAAHLVDDGVFLMVDMHAASDVGANLDLPWAPYLYTVSAMHCMTVSLSLGGDGLGTAWGTELAPHMLAEAGFGVVQVERLPEDFINDYDVARK